jgi:hypothetical protein
MAIVKAKSIDVDTLAFEIQNTKKVYCENSEHKPIITDKVKVVGTFRASGPTAELKEDLDDLFEMGVSLEHFVLTCGKDNLTVILSEFKIVQLGEHRYKDHMKFDMSRLYHFEASNATYEVMEEKDKLHLDDEEFDMSKFDPNDIKITNLKGID